MRVCVFVCACAYIYIYIYISGGPLSALTCGVNVRLAELHCRGRERVFELEARSP